MSSSSNSDVSLQLVKTIGGLFMLKMFIALFTNKLGRSLEKRYVD